MPFIDGLKHKLEGCFLASPREVLPLQMGLFSVASHLVGSQLLNHVTLTKSKASK